MNKQPIWTLDAHCDSIYMRNFLGNSLDLSQDQMILSQTILNIIAKEYDEEKDLPAGNYTYHSFFESWKKGNINAIFLNVGDYDLSESSKIIDELYKLLEKYPEKFDICRTRKEIENTVSANKLAIILAIEGQLMFQNNLQLLHDWHKLGVRIASITHGEGTDGLTNGARLHLQDNASAMQKYALQITPSTESYLTKKDRKNLYKKEKGLTHHGKTVLKEMEKLNMICDLTHANDKTFWETLELSNGKLCTTHSNCAKLCSHSRNLTDEMMKALAQKNGVMGLCFFGEFIDQKKPTFKKFVDHVLHALEIMGDDHVGIGSDYDGVPPDAFMAIPTPAKMQKLWIELDKAGINQKTITKIAHGNFMRLLSSEHSN